MPDCAPASPPAGTTDESPGRRGCGNSATRRWPRLLGPWSAMLCVVLGVSGVPAVAHDYRVGSIRVVHPYATPTLPGKDSAAAYVGLENRGREADRLLSASADIAATTEMHETVVDGDVMRMRPVGAIPIAAGATIAMTPGKGPHLMLGGLKQPLKEGDRFVLNLTFERAGPTAVTVWVQAADKGAAAAKAHAGH